MTPNTEEYLRGFLPLCFSASMDAMTEEALADALDDLAEARAREWCAEDCQLEVPQEPVVRNLAADIARRLRKGGNPAFSGHCGRACEYNGRRYASISAMARELEINWKNALVLVESRGRWL